MYSLEGKEHIRKLTAQPRLVLIREIIEKPVLREDKGRHPSGQDPTHLNFQVVKGKSLGIVF